MHSCRVFIEPLIESQVDENIIPDGLVLRAAVVGGKQIVIEGESAVLCSVFNAATSLPINVVGFPAFFVVNDNHGCVAKLQGAVTTSSVEFTTSKFRVPRGFYKYEIVIGGQVVAQGSCVVR